jgi:hypothetical protein
MLHFNRMHSERERVLLGLREGGFEVLGAKQTKAPREFTMRFGEAKPAEAEQQEDLTKQLAAVKAADPKLTAQGRTKDDSDFYVVVVSGSYNEQAECLKAFGFANNRYIDGRTLVDVFRDVARRVKEAKLADHGVKPDRARVDKNKPKTAKEPR